MSLENIKIRIEELAKEKEILKNDFKKWLADESNSLDYRFETLMNIGLGDTSMRTDFNLGDDQFLWDSPIYMNKYETYSIKDIYDILLDVNYLKEDQKITFKQYCIDNFISKITFDW